MCGIHGIYRLDGKAVAPEMLSAMGDVTRHRGPDDEGMHIDASCGIAMRRLSIIDLAGGHQPLSNIDETLWVVCNGEIYNFRELRAELEAKGYRFKTGSDSEVLLHLYDAEGDDFVHRLNGMFDFALWDVRRRRLLIGRDRLGVKPLYVLQDGCQLAFATEAKSSSGLARGHGRTGPKCRRRLPAFGLRGCTRLHLQRHTQAAPCHAACCRKWPGAGVALLETPGSH